MTAHYRVNFTCADNEDLRQPFVLTDSAGTLIDLTGATMRMRLERVPGGDAVDATTTNGQIILTDAPHGAFEVAIPASVMAAREPGVYQHDLVLTLAGRTTRIWSGSVDLNRGVTP